MHSITWQPGLQFVCTVAHKHNAPLISTFVHYRVVFVSLRCIFLSSECFSFSACIFILLRVLCFLCLHFHSPLSTCFHCRAFSFSSEYFVFSAVHFPSLPSGLCFSAIHFCSLASRFSLYSAEQCSEKEKCVQQRRKNSSAEQQIIECVNGRSIVLVGHRTCALRFCDADWHPNTPTQVQCVLLVESHTFLKYDTAFDKTSKSVRYCTNITLW